MAGGLRWRNHVLILIPARWVRHRITVILRRPAGIPTRLASPKIRLANRMMWLGGLLENPVSRGANLWPNTAVLGLSPPWPCPSSYLLPPCTMHSCHNQHREATHDVGRIAK